MNRDNNKKIAKNTVFLYFRLLITMLINIYTARIILDTLGIDDYGIYNVVAGVIILFSFINSSMSTATSRFITFELGKSMDTQKLQKVFSASCTIHVLIALVVLILGETIGLYLVDQKLVIPDSRKFAAMIIYQISLAMVIISILQTPYTASIFAHEKMNVYAIVEILNSLLKLIIAIILPLFLFDKLITYSVMLFFSIFIIALIYVIYCNKNLTGCRFILTRDKRFLKPMTSFSGWDLYGNMSTIARTQGVNILLNLFFGPVLNTANGIAMQVQSAVSTFATNLLLAVRPQIVKSYAKNDIQYTLWLLQNTIQLTTILLLILCLPIIAEMPFILEIWLGYFPKETVVFGQLTLIFIIFSNISLCLMSVLHATGRIKRSSIINGSIYLSVIPLTYISFKLGFPSYVPFVLNIAFVIIGTLLNMTYVKQAISEFSISLFLKKCILNIALMTIIIVAIIIVLTSTLESGWDRFIIIILTNTLLSIILAYFLVLDNGMRNIIINEMKKYVRKRFS